MIIVTGARYSGVPQTLLASFGVFTLSLDNPKSAILTYPSASISTFSGFKLVYLRY